jgi:hypothetical protein
LALYWPSSRRLVSMMVVESSIGAAVESEASAMDRRLEDCRKCIMLVRFDALVNLKGLLANVVIRC